MNGIDELQSLYCELYFETGEKGQLFEDKFEMHTRRKALDEEVEEGL